MIMRYFSPHTVIIVALFMTLLPTVSVAEPDEVTMQVLEEGAPPESTYRVIELPPPASTEAARQPSQGRDSQPRGEANAKASEVRNEAVSAAQNATQDRISSGAVDRLPEQARERIPDRIPAGPPEDIPGGPPGNIPSAPDFNELPGAPDNAGDIPHQP